MKGLRYMNKPNLESNCYKTHAKIDYNSYVKSSFRDSEKLLSARDDINRAMQLFEKETKPTTPDQLKNAIYIFGLAGEIYAHLDKEKSLEYFKLFQYYLFKDLMKADKYGFKSEKEVIAYKFRKCSTYLFRDLAGKKITLSRPKFMNDPFDSLYNIWSMPQNLSDVVKDKEHLELLHQSYAYYRFCSFCVGDENRILKNILMWSHYADEHRGICIKYKLKNDCIDTESSEDIHHQMTLRKVICDNKIFSIHRKYIDLKDAFLRKALCWKYEREARLISFDDIKDGKEIDGDRIGLDYKDNIVIDTIFFGVDCSSEDKAIIKNLLPEHNIKYCEMKKNPDDIFNLDIDGDKQEL